MSSVVKSLLIFTTADVCGSDGEEGGYLAGGSQYTNGMRGASIVAR